jgi:hypothetical protein
MPPKAVQKKKVSGGGKKKATRAANSGEHSDYYLDWNCNSAGAITVLNSTMGFPANRPCKVLWVRITAVASNNSKVTGFTLYNSAGVQATSCAPKLLNTQRQVSFKLVMPRSEDFSTLPAAFKLITPNPAVGGFNAVVHARLAFTPQIVFPSLAFSGGIETTDDDDVLNATHSSH